MQLLCAYFAEEAEEDFGIDCRVSGREFGLAGVLLLLARSLIISLIVRYYYGRFSGVTLHAPINSFISN